MKATRSMSSGQLKARNFSLLSELELQLAALSKPDVLELVAANTKPGGEREGTFIKFALRNPLESLFGSLGLTIEGIQSKGRTQFKKDFFGKKPALDFVVHDLELVGEVKYCKLDLQSLATALGQPAMYIGASRAESQQFSYGATIFCNCASSATYCYGEVERQFKLDLWEKQDLYLIVL